MDPCRICGGPATADNTIACPPGYIGSVGICWDCHLEATGGYGLDSFRAFHVRDFVVGQRDAEELRRAEALFGLDDDLSGGCYREIL